MTRQTASKWVSDITDRRRTVRKVRALLLSRLGWSNRQVAEFLEVDEITVRRDVNDDILSHLSEDVLRNALDGLPGQCADIAEQIREERIFANWTDVSCSTSARLWSGSGGRPSAGTSTARPSFGASRARRALLLSRLGWSQEQTGEYLGVDQSTIMRDVNDDILHNLTEDILRAALDGLPEQCADIAEQASDDVNDDITTHLSEDVLGQVDGNVSFNIFVHRPFTNLQELAYLPITPPEPRQ
ncbi:MAG: hypothetical protein ACRDO8_05940 [Nocardioidaceae bacterium]